jgi:tetratricopeptide (TPR) repeat protein
MKPQTFLSPRFVVAGLGALAAVLVFPIDAHADAGVPMLALMAVPMWASLLVIIPLEAYIATKRIGVGWWRCVKVSAVANLVSTVVGVPVTWILLVLAEISMSYLGQHLMPAQGPAHTVPRFWGAALTALNVILTAPWLVPIESDLYWMIPTAALILCLPFFLASVWIEYRVARRMVGLDRGPRAFDWAWRANLASYILLGLVPTVLLGKSLVDHHAKANDEVHRSVDLVSAERLWDLAVARVHQAKTPRVAATEIDGRPARRTPGDSLWRAGDDAHRSGDDRLAETKWRAALGELDRPHHASTLSMRAGTISTVEVLLSLADLYYAEARYAEAIPLYQRLSAIRDSNLAKGYDGWSFPGASAELAIAYERVGKPELAESYCQHVVDQEERLTQRNDDDLMWALTGLGRHCAARGDSARAEELWQRTIALARETDDLSRSDEQAYHLLAAKLRGEKRLPEAAELLSAGIARYADIYGQGEFSDSLGAGPLFLDLALVYLDQGALPQATHYIKSALRWDSRLQDAAEAYAGVLDREGRAAEADSWRRRARAVSEVKLR